MTANIETFPIITDRTRVEDFHRCPRRRWWQFEYLNEFRIEKETGGVVSNGISMFLLTGIGVHQAMEVLGKEMLGKGADFRFTNEQIYQASQVAQTVYFDTLTKRGLLIGPKATPEAITWTGMEQWHLVEGLVWMLGTYLLPSFVTKYEVLEVEEDSIELIEPTGLNVHLAYKPDAVLRDRDSGELFTLSLKTAGQTDWYTDYNFDRDLQGVTEPWCATRRLYRAGKIDRQISGAQMLYLIKGKRYEEKLFKDGRKVTYNPLIRGFKLPGPTQSEDQWAWSNTVEKMNKAGELYQGRLGDAWKAFSIWDPKDGYPGGVSAWVRALGQGRIEPAGQDPFASCWYMPQPQLGRDPSLIERRLLQLAVQEREIAANSRRINSYLLDGVSIEDSRVQTALDITFPMYTRGCEAMGGTCEYDSLCFGGGGAGVLQVKLQTDFQPREPHHQRLEAFAA